MAKKKKKRPTLRETFMSQVEKSSRKLELEARERAKTEKIKTGLKI